MTSRLLPSSQPHAIDPSTAARSAWSSPRWLGVTSRVARLSTASALLCALGCTPADADLQNDAILSFTLDPASDSVKVFSVDAAGKATVAYQSDQPATLEVMVEGRVVHEQSYSIGKSLGFPISTHLPLLHEGPNEIVATLTYNGGVETVRHTVTVTEPAATVTFPTWTTDHDQTQVVTVVPGDPAWSASALEYSINGGTWTEAAAGDNGTFTLPLHNLDIGDNELAVRAHTANLGHERVDTIVTTIPGIKAVFDCTSPSSMLPTNDLYARGQQGTGEVRTMTGYFGDPSRGHDILFVIDYDWGGTQVSHGALVNARAYDSMSVAFSTTNVNCGAIIGNSEPYSLSLYVDGVKFCDSNGTYGRIVCP